jgi:broad specificity phosphatase PhoE
MESLDELVAKYAIKLKVPKIEDKDLKTATFIIIRHAYSEYNYREQKVKEEFGDHSEELIALKGDRSMYDPGLHSIGRLQAESNQDLVNEINFKVVFVSPLQRTLQTCIHMFKAHPNKEEIRFIVLPVVREVLETSNDIALDIDHIIDKYSPG